tara:strand:+ start:121 stop:1413 length:1293 start_codon:yes stop_codon:yes gene_type:complete
MEIYFNNLIKNLYNNLEKVSFYIGIFLLASAFSISLLFLLLSLILTFLKYRTNYFNDKWNIYFFIGSLILILSAVVNFFNSSSNTFNLNKSIGLIGLANWIPLIIIFIVFEKYLTKPKQRKIFADLLLLGAVPVIISGIGQLFFEWHGPIETFNGLIVWYQRPLNNNFFEVTGLFNNPNYAGAYLNIIWPFALASCLKKNKKFPLRLISICFSLSIFLFLILTGSRAAWLGMIISIPLVFGFKSLKWFLPLILFVSTFIISIIFPIFGEISQNFLQSIIPKYFWADFTSEGYLSLDSSRLEIWLIAIKAIAKNPIIGNGAGTFSTIFENQTGFWKGHPHNLPLELAVSYGLPGTLIIILPIFFIAVLSIKKLFINLDSNYEYFINERAWLTSLLILILSQMVDIQYFDGKISIAGWLLLCGTKKMLKDNN